MIKYKDRVKVLEGFYAGVEGEAVYYNENTSHYVIQLTDGNNIEIASKNVEKVENE